jgi:hypothetical protein
MKTSLQRFVSKVQNGNVGQDEYTLLGKAIKFAGLHGKEVRIIGTNRETLKEKPELIQ